MDEVRSNLQEQLDIEAQRKQAIEAAQERVQKQLKLLQDISEGKLGFKDYQKLPTRAKRRYRMRHGAPKSPEELRARKAQRKRAIRRKEIARRSRWLNLRLARRRKARR